MNGLQIVTRAIYGKKKPPVKTEKNTYKEIEELKDAINVLIKEQSELKSLILSLTDTKPLTDTKRKQASAKKKKECIELPVVKETDENISWRQSVYKRIKAVVSRSTDESINKDYVFKLIYEKMKRNYGFVEDQERKEFLRRHPYHKGYVTRMEIIEESGTWSSIFDSILEDILNSLIIKIAKSSSSEDVKKLPLPSSTKEENKRISKDKESIVLENIKNMDSIADKVAAKIGDKNFRHAITYRAIYANMNVRWKMIETLFEKRFGHKATSKKYLIGGSTAALKEFKRAAQDIIDK